MRKAGLRKVVTCLASQLLSDGFWFSWNSLTIKMALQLSGLLSEEMRLLLLELIKQEMPPIGQNLSLEDEVQTRKMGFILVLEE